MTFGAPASPPATHRLDERRRSRARRGGAPSGTVVTAGEQTAGRGRRGRVWSAPPGKALLYSAILRPLELEHALLPLSVPIAVCEAVESLAPVKARIKWPNDVWIDEAQGRRRPDRGPPAGLGGDRNRPQRRDRPDEFPADLRWPATSVGHGVAVDDARVALSAALGRWVEAPKPKRSRRTATATRWPGVRSAGTARRRGRARASRPGSTSAATCSSSAPAASGSRWAPARSACGSRHRVVGVVRILPLSTGTVRVKHSFLFARSGLRRELGLFTPGPFSDPLPVHLWLVEHEGSGSSSTPVRSRPSTTSRSRSSTSRPTRSAGGAGGDRPRCGRRGHGGPHPHARRPHGRWRRTSAAVRCSCRTADWPSPARAGRQIERVLRQPVPAGVRFEPIALGEPFGAFAASRPLTDDGRVVVVATPGAHPGARERPLRRRQRQPRAARGRRHGLARAAAGQTTRRRGAQAGGDGRHDRPDPGARLRPPAVFLPSHDPESATRLAEREILDPGTVLR